MSDRKIKLLIFLTALSSGVLLISNIAATKLWDFFGIAVDGGIVCFPLTYILGDLIVEFYGKKHAKTVIFSSFLLNIIATLVFWITIALPSYPGWEGQEAFAAILGFTPRIVIGSLLAYLISNLFNNYIFIKLKNSKGAFSRSFIARAICSSIFARIIDSLIFETIAFVGVLPFNDFLLQASFAFLAGTVLEIILSPLESIVAKQVQKYVEK